LAEPIVWPVSEFTLVESTLARGGSRYDIVGRWPASA
jgi:2'-5' RNA ligase